MSRIAIIDGDCLCYRAFQPRWLDTVNPHGVNEIILDDNGQKVQKEYTKEENAAYLKKSYETLKHSITTFQERFFCDDFLMAVQGKGNYRPTEISSMVPILRTLAVYEGLAIASSGCEADDLIRIWAEECRRADREFVIISLDKDLQCIPGKHHVIHKNITIDVSEFQAMYNYHYQLIVGDQVDNIPGAPRKGPKAAEKALAGCVTLEDFQEAVVMLYVDCLGDSWREYLLSNGKLIHLQRHQYDYFDLSDWPIAQVIP
jgi:5'-3' exonuclease